jgi:uncharacterized protein (TIGR02217 family)
MSALVYPGPVTAELRLVPMYETSIKTYTGGQEQRDQRHLSPRFRVELTYDPLILQAAWVALDFFYHRHRGRFETFLFQDWTVTAGVLARDRTGEFLGLGNGDQVDFYLYENVVDSAIIYLDDVAQTQGATPQVTVDELTGLVTFTTAPAVDAVITADVVNAFFRVRFDLDAAEWDRIRGAGWRGRITLQQPNRATG